MNPSAELKDQLPNANDLENRRKAGSNLEWRTGLWSLEVHGEGQCMVTAWFGAYGSV